MALGGSRACFGFELKSTLGSTEEARIGLASRHPICSKSKAPITHAQSSLRASARGKNGITEFIVINPPSPADISGILGAGGRAVATFNQCGNPFPIQGELTSGTNDSPHDGKAP